MSRTALNYIQLRSLLSDIHTVQQSSPSIAFFLNDKIERFYKLNAIRIKTMNEKIVQIAKRFAELDEKGNPKTEEKDGELKFVFENDEKKQAYFDEYELFMQTTFDVNL